MRVDHHRVGNFREVIFSLYSRIVRIHEISTVIISQNIILLAKVGKQCVIIRFSKEWSAELSESIIRT